MRQTFTPQRPEIAAFRQAFAAVPAEPARKRRRRAFGTAFA
ncbi:hypothetical protein ACFQFS_02100 [Novosphingobium lubricantis]|jgi:hypothetical protein